MWKLIPLGHWVLIGLFVLLAFSFGSISKDPVAAWVCIGIAVAVAYVGRRVRCSHCRARVRRDATACARCGRDLTPEVR